MTNIIINAKNHTIEMNKTVSKAASIFGTDEYNALQAVRRDYPTFKVVTVSKKRAKPEYKGLSYEYMEKYISAHDNEEKTIMAEYNVLRGKSESGIDAMADAVCYADVKEWFLMTFPSIEKFHSDRDALLRKISMKREERLAAKKAV